MPRLSDSMEEGTILSWLVADGEPVSSGSELVEIETDKANMIFEADADGLLHRVAGEGDTLPIGALIARILLPGERTPAISETREGVGEAVAQGGPSEDHAALPSQQCEEQGSARVKASPLARRLAGEYRIDLGKLAGSGSTGRIIKVDVEQAIEPGASRIETRSR